MAKSKLSSAYKSAASSGSSYQASLYDVANIGHQRESSAQLAEIKAQDRSRTVGMISEGLDLAGNVIRKGQRRKEMKTASDALGAKAKDMSLWGRLTGEEQMYEKVGESGEMGTVSGSDIMAEYKLQEQEKAFGRSSSVDETTGKATSTPAKKVPEVKTTPKKDVQGPPAPKEDKQSMAKEVGISKGSSLFNVTSPNQTKSDTSLFDSTPKDNSNVPFYEKYSYPKQKKYEPKKRHSLFSEQ